MSSENGNFNLTAPTPVTNKVFSKTMAHSMKKPCIFRIPNFLVNQIFGEMGREIILGGQKVIPTRLKRLGYKFKYADLKKAFDNVLGS